MIIVSYYTKNTPYEEVLNTKLLPSLKKWKLKYDIQAIVDKGSWQANTHFKAEFIREMLKKHNEAIVFLDSDATIEQFPELFCKLEKEKYDISYHELDWYKMWRKQEGNSKREVLSGTLFINNTAISYRFLNNWIEYNKQSKNWEQRNMEKILEKWKNKLKIYPLPYSYITIMYRNNTLPLHMIKESEIVILHHQASRRLKNRTNWRNK